MKRMTAAVAAVAVALACAGGAQAQQRRRASARQPQADVRALRAEVEALKEGQREMQAELRELRQLVERLAESGGRRGPTHVSVDDDPSIGEKTARVVIIDFSDFQ